MGQTKELFLNRVAFEVLGDSFGPQRVAAVDGSVLAEVSVYFPLDLVSASASNSVFIDFVLCNLLLFV